jgi:large subunit ribosomal protein L23
MKSPYQIIKRPVITEKSTTRAQQNQYTFEVDKRASKNEIGRAVERHFGVTVLAVQTANVKGKPTRTGRRRAPAKKSDWKKAVVMLKEGDKIELFEVGG